MRSRGMPVSSYQAQFIERIGEMTDAELWRVLENASEYTPQALAEARAEIERRGGAEQLARSVSESRAATDEGLGRDPHGAGRLARHLGRAGELTSRAELTIAALCYVILTDVGSIASAFPYAAYLRSLEPGTNLLEEELVSSEVAYGLVAMAQVLALGLAALFFFRWFRLAYLNVRFLTGSPTAHGPWAPVWGFVVPILSLFIPQRLMREIWEDFSLRWIRDPERAAGRSYPDDVVNLWWGLFLLTVISDRVITRFESDLAGAAWFLAWVWVPADLVNIVAAVVAILLVRNVTALQRPFLHEPD